MKNWVKITYIILHIVSVFASILLIGIAGDYSKVGEYKEILFVFSGVVNTVPFIFLWACFWGYCFKCSIRRKNK